MSAVHCFEKIIKNYTSTFHGIKICVMLTKQLVKYRHMLYFLYVLIVLLSIVFIVYNFIGHSFR